MIKALRRTADQLNTLSRQPQGAPQIDSQVYPDECTPTFPFHFDFLLASDVLIVNRVRLSFFLRAFRRTLASANTATSGASSAASAGASSAVTSTNGSITTSTSALHGHIVDVPAGTPNGNPLYLYGNSTINVAGGPGGFGTRSDGGHTHDLVHTHDDAHSHPIPHTHDVVPGLTDGIWEGAIATGVTVKVNGVDRTVALGGGAGFTTNQTELVIDPAWLNPFGQWNTIDLTPSGLGRITGHLTVVSYIQSA